MTVKVIKPEEVYICVLCHYFVHPPSVDQATGEPLPPQQSSHRIALFILKLLKGSVAACYPSLRELCQRLVDQLGALGAELVRQLDIILQGINTPDDLANVMEAVGTQLKAQKQGTAARITGIDPGSVMGVFLRRVRATFLLAPYPVLLSTTTALQQELQIAAEAAAASAEASSDMVGNGQETARQTAPRPSLRSGAAVEQYLNNLLRTVEQKGAVAITAEDREALEHTQTVQGLATSAMEGAPGNGVVGSDMARALPRALHVEFAIAAAEGDYTRAVHYLHAYFDTVQASRLAAPFTDLLDASAKGNGLSGVTGMPAGVKSRHQSALLSLAALHTRLGHTKEAMDALGEVLRASQQAGDPWTSVHVLAAMCQLTQRAVPGAPGLQPVEMTELRDGGQAVRLHQLLNRCLKRATELHCPHLAVFARLGLATWQLQHTVQGSNSPDANQTAAEADFVGSTHANNAMTGNSNNTVPFGGSSMSDIGSAASTAAVQGVQNASRHVLHVAHVSRLEAAAGPNPLTTTIAAVGRGPAVPELYGQPRVFKQPSTWACCNSMARVTAQHAASGRLLHAAAWSYSGNLTLFHTYSLAYLACHGSHARVEDTELAMAQQLQAIQQAQGPQAASLASSITQAALPAITTNTLRAVIGSAAHELARIQGKVRTAWKLTKHLQSLCDPCGHVDAHLQLHALHSQAQGQLSEGNLAASRDTALQCFKCSRVWDQQVWSTQSMLTLGKIWLAAGAPTKAQPYLHSCLLHARSSHQDFLAAEASLLLAKTWVMISPKLAMPTMLQLQGALSVVCAHGGPQLQGEMAMTMAQLLIEGLHLSADTPSNSNTRNPAARGRNSDSSDDVQPVIELLDSAVHAFEQAGDLQQACQAALLSAVISNKAGLLQFREKAAKHALSLQEKLQRVKLEA